MPKGVEHTKPQTLNVNGIWVRLSVMPKGVEHRYIPYLSIATFVCDFQ